MNNNFSFQEIEEEIEKDKSNLIKTLQSIQKKEGHISINTIKAVAVFFEMSPAEIEGVVSFYTQFKRIKSGKYKICICDGTACHIKGSNFVLNWLEDELKIGVGQTDNQGLFSIDSVACLGCCSLAPVISINGKVYGNLDRKKMLNLLNNYRQLEAK